MKIFNLGFSDKSAFRNVDCRVKALALTNNNTTDIRLNNLLISFNYKDVNFKFEIEFNHQQLNYDLITICVGDLKQNVKVPSVTKDITTYKASVQLN